MRVKPHADVGALFDAWVRSLHRQVEVRERWAKQYWSDFVKTLTDANGPPRGSVAAPQLSPEHWWVAFPPCYLALVKFSTTRGWFGWFRRRQAEVVDLNFSPGLRG